MKGLLSTWLRNWSIIPEQVDIREVDGERVVVFEVWLNPTIGKVIAKRTHDYRDPHVATRAAKHGKRHAGNHRAGGTAQRRWR